MTYQYRIIEALADPTRRAVFEALGKNPEPVGKLAEKFSVSRPAVSQHLRVLKAAGLVEGRAEGTRRIYSVAPQGLAPLREWLEQFWADALGSYAKEVELQAQEQCQVQDKEEN